VSKKSIHLAILIFCSIAILLYFFLTNKTRGSNIMSKKSFKISDAENALLRIKQDHGLEMAEIVERLYRWETNHFKSGQFKATGSPGMEAHGSAPYYGWNSSFWVQNPTMLPSGTWDAFENSGMSAEGGNAQVVDKKKQFLIFESVYHAMSYLVSYINRHNGNYARWYSTNRGNQTIYINALNSVRPRIVDSFA
jgi:hypothetical protein